MKPRIRYNSKGCWYECKGLVNSVFGEAYLTGFGPNPEAAFSCWKRRAALYGDMPDLIEKERDYNRNAWTGSEPAALQSETATNALHQHQLYLARNSWKIKVLSALKRLVHNHPSR